MKIISILKEIKDRRANNGKEYQLWEIVLFSIFAIMSNAKNYLDIQCFIEENFSALKETFKLKWRRSPTHSAVWKILTGIDLEEFESAFRKFSAKLQPEGNHEQHICFDGKTLCGSASETRQKKALRIFNAFANAGELIITHIPMDSDKDSETMALKKLFQQLNLKGSVITADALHCQKIFLI